MFYQCSRLNAFNGGDMTKLDNGNNMFCWCLELTEFISDVRSLINGRYMFAECAALTSFRGNLMSLTNGDYMFYETKLDAPSVENIIDTLNTVESGKLRIGMGCENDSFDIDLFAQEIGYNTMTELRDAITSKGWTLNTQYNGRPTATYNMRNSDKISSPENSLPIFVKLIEDEEFTNYISNDETTKYHLDWFHETTGSTDGYTQFDSLESAIESLGIKPIVR